MEEKNSIVGIIPPPIVGNQALKSSKFKIVDYFIQLGKKGFNGGDYSAIIYCFGSRNRKLEIYFYESEPETPYNNTSDLEKDVGSLYIHIHQYPFYLDLLRNEIPAYVVLSEKPEYNLVTSEKEELDYEKKYVPPDDLKIKD